MNKTILSAGVALSAIGLVAGTPVQASTLSFNFELDTSAEVELSSLFAGRTLGDITLPDSIDVMAEDVTGSFTVLDDLAQVTDGDIELNYNFLNGALSSYEATLDSLLGSFGFTSEQALQSVDNLFAVTQFSGNGVLTSNSFDVAGNPNNPSPFNLTYNNQTNSVVIDGYSKKVAASCLSANCDITGTVSYGVGLVISEFVTFTGGLLTNPNITLSAEASSAISSLQQTAAFIQRLNPSLEMLDLATVSATISADTEFASSNPDGSAADISVDVTSGLLTASATTDGQPEQLFTREYIKAPESTGVDSETVVESAIVTNLTVAGTPPSTSASPTLPSAPTLIAQLPAKSGVNNNAQDVPEPSILLGLLGTAVLVKRSHKKTIV